MTKEVVTKYTCDRCKKPFAYTADDQPAEDAGQAAFAVSIYILDGDNQLVEDQFVFNDLCVRCRGRLLDLIGSIKLDKGAEADKNAAEPAAASSAPSTGPSSTEDSPPPKPKRNSERSQDLIPH